MLLGQVENHMVRLLNREEKFGSIRQKRFR